MKPGDIISYLDMCRGEGVNLQRGMNFRLRGRHSVILMNVSPGAPYSDRFEDEGRTLIYEGHDAPRKKGQPDPKAIDQPMRNTSGSLTQNGRFYAAATDSKAHNREPETVKVYEKLERAGWVYNGLFRLIDAWQETDSGRSVFKFKLVLDDALQVSEATATRSIEHHRLIPTSVKLEVWKRDGGKCVRCGTRDNLHFDHIIPYSKGGTSLVAGNIQILCVRHNLEKRDKIE